MKIRIIIEALFSDRVGSSSTGGARKFVQARITNFVTAELSSTLATSVTRASYLGPGYRGYFASHKPDYSV